MHKGEQSTGMKDRDYDIVSVLHASLKEAEVCEQYAEDCDQAGDREAAEFMRSVQDQNRHCVQRAKDLLKQRL